MKFERGLTTVERWAGDKRVQTVEEITAVDVVQTLQLDTQVVPNHYVYQDQTFPSGNRSVLRLPNEADIEAEIDFYEENAPGEYSPESLRKKFTKPLVLANNIGSKWVHRPYEEFFGSIAAKVIDRGGSVGTVSTLRSGGRAFMSCVIAAHTFPWSQVDSVLNVGAGIDGASASVVVMGNRVMACGNQYSLDIIQAARPNNENRSATLFRGKHTAALEGKQDRFLELFETALELAQEMPEAIEHLGNQAFPEEKLLEFLQSRQGFDLQGAHQKGTPNAMTTYHNNMERIAEILDKDYLGPLRNTALGALQAMQEFEQNTTVKLPKGTDEVLRKSALAERTIERATFQNAATAYPISMALARELAVV